MLKQKQSDSFIEQNPIQPNIKCWFYIDDENKVQGSFTSLEMRKWYFQGYFKASLKISFLQAKSINDFIPLSNFLLNPGLLFQKYYQQSQSQPSQQRT